MNSSPMHNSPSVVLSPALALIGAGMALGSLAVDGSALQVLMRVVAVLLIALSGVSLGLVLRSREVSRHRG